MNEQEKIQSPLDRLRDMLAEKRGEEKNYRIPRLWNAAGFVDFTPLEGEEIALDPATFFLHAIDYIYRQGETMEEKRWNKDMRSHQIYAMLVRSQTAWNHSEDGPLEAGTFLKTIALLPYIQQMGFDLLYLLPVFQSSDNYKKGSLGSPYAVQDFLRLDPIQHDPVLGEYSEELLDLEFAAFVEACHMLNMHVMVDFIFRTCARDHCWIREHPDWFYWIDLPSQEEFSAIEVADLPALSPPNSANMELVYNTHELYDYLSRFRFDPRAQDAARFEALCAENPDDGALLRAIEENFNITTAPAFSDVLNDPQPPWSDVTYLRFDMGLNEMAAGHVPENMPPFILNDGIKMSEFEPDQLNRELSDRLADLLPVYARKYGIDGARLDMGHALPTPVRKRILRKIRDIRPDFILWSEVFEVGASYEALKEGYDFISGNLWAAYPKRYQGDFNRENLLPLTRYALPSVAAICLPDSPRAAAVVPDLRERSNVFVFNALLPNAIPFVTGGCEFGEKQAMNLGLGDHGACHLAEDDPMRGKLAFFDLYRLHWQEADAELLQNVRRANRLRQGLMDLIAAPNAFMPGEIFEEMAMDSRFFYRTTEGELSVRWARNLAGVGAMAEETRLLYRSGFAGGNDPGGEREIPGDLIVLLHNRTT